MGCCGKPRANFKANLKKAQTPKVLLDIPDEKLDPVQLGAKHRMVRIRNRAERIKRRNERALRVKAKNERKAIDN